MNTTTFFRNVGDLDSPCLADEGQRHAWYEASTVGFQVTLLGGLVLATAMIWLGPPAVFNWALALVMLSGLGAVIALRHAQQLGYRQRGLEQFARPRGLVGLALLLLFIAGLFFGRASALEGQLSTGIGAICGSAVALLSVWIGSRLYTRREAREAHLDIE